MTCGILLLDKPQGLSSSAAVQRVRRALNRIKAGHTGSLDPLATGMLPICLGEATKVAGYLLEGDKHYAFTARFGARTTTGDLEGPVAEVAPVPEDLQSAIRHVLLQFTGPIQQIPPMYSALKRDGQPLYKLARQGIEVDRPARDIRIHRLTLLDVQGADARFEVICSKGTYIRTLAEDIARALGSCAHLSVLRRTAVQPFEERSTITLDAFESDPGAASLLAPDAALLHLPEIRLEPGLARRLGLGQVVLLPGGAPGTGLARVYQQEGAFLGIGELLAGETLKPVRLFNDLGPSAT
jgi:tRNA pseudouridine55 synthase